MDLLFSISEDKLGRLRKMLSDLKRLTAVKVRGRRNETQGVHIRVLAKVLGTLQSLRLTTGPLTAVMTCASTPP